ncbi:PE domain-containing protein [Mycobacterium sp. DSM 3803]|jgi:hypothetical protein|nr:PE domain-containing protein [Mycobacterium sp. DSM 3803]OKH61720.1 hypothetical protein EB73_29440 [Mycobacterium sp. SWH-M3]
MSFIYAETAGMAAAGATQAALAAQTAASSAQAMGAGVVVPPGLEEVSALNVAKITGYTAEAASLLGLAGVIQTLYGTSVTTAAAGYTAFDLAAATMLAPS